MVVVSGTAALLPDTDHPYSLAGRCIPRLLWPWVIGEDRDHNHHPDVYWLSRPAWSPHFRRWGRWRPGGVIWHRCELHSLAMGILFSLIVGGVALMVSPTSPKVALAILLGSLIGWLSHLLVDLLNVSPLMIAWPLSRKLWRPRWLPGIPESSWRGHLLEGATVCFCLALLGLDALVCGLL